MWTSDCTKALMAIAAGTKGALKQQKKKQVSYLNKLTAIIRGQLSKVERNKVVALITMEIHNRDVIERMVKANCNSVSDFEWLSQLRFVFLKEAGEFGKWSEQLFYSIKHSIIWYSFTVKCDKPIRCWNILMSIKETMVDWSLLHSLTAVY